MPYIVDDSKCRFKSGLTGTAEKKYEEWKAYINQNGLHPKNAAARVGDSNYKKLNAVSEVYEFRLTGRDRVLFEIVGMTVKVKQVGGHT